MSPIMVRDDEIVQEVTIKAPAERIFAALTKPDELLKWWVVEGKFKLVQAECDLQPGGKWVMHLVGNCAAESSTSTVYGEFREIEAPRLLTYTWIRENEDYPETLVRWDLEEKDGYTTVRVTHSGLVSESLLARNSGWPVIVQLLEAYMETRI